MCIGLVLDVYFLVIKLLWLLDWVKEEKFNFDFKNVLVGIIDIWVLWKLIGGKVYVIDYSNVSCIMLMNIEFLNWD